MDTDVKVGTITYDDYLESVIIGSVQYKSWRVGQVAFNMLSSYRPDIAERLRGGPHDPFYVDHLPHGHDRLAVFLAHVREAW